jgi:formylglycine-generating enzyme required for sulfatase activity
MPRRICILLFTFTIAAVTALAASAQLLPEVTPKPAKPPAAKPAQIVVQTSPNAEVYFDDEYRGRASPQGRLVIANPKPGEHNLRVSLTGKKDFEQKVTVVGGKELRIVATPADLPGSILVTTTPGAEVSLDNSSRGTVDANGQFRVSDVAAGDHMLRIAARAKKDFSQTVNVARGQETRVEATLADLAGSILVTTTPGGEVTLDNSSRGAADANGQLRVSDVATGDHALRITARGKKDFSQTVNVLSARETRVEAALADLPGSILVTTTPGAGVSLDNSVRGVSDASGLLVVLGVASGVHALRITLRGKKDFSQTVNVRSGRETRVQAALADLLGSILVATTPGAEVSLDNLSRGIADTNGKLTVSDVATGAHALRVTARGKKDFIQVVNVSSGQQTRVEVALWELRPPTQGDVRENPRDGLKYVWIQPGSFKMGCSRGDKECLDDEKPSHQVTISKGFWIGQTEVTVGAYKRFAAATGRQMPPAPDFNGVWANEDMPIVDVSWDDARQYCTWAGARLLTEAEWEYGARGGSTEACYGNIDEIAWYNNNSGASTHDVAQKHANGFGLFDVLGNVWEWVNDWYDERYYRKSPSQDPGGPITGQYRVLRGGSWYDSPRLLRVSGRSRYHPGDWYLIVGVRCGGEVVKP